MRATVLLLVFAFSFQSFAIDNFRVFNQFKLDNCSLNNPNYWSIRILNFCNNLATAADIKQKIDDAHKACVADHKARYNALSAETREVELEVLRLCDDFYQLEMVMIAYMSGAARGEQMVECKSGKASVPSNANR